MGGQHISHSVFVKGSPWMSLFVFIILVFRPTQTEGNSLFDKEPNFGASFNPQDDKDNEVKPLNMEEDFIIVDDGEPLFPESRSLFSSTGRTEKSIGRGLQISQNEISEYGQFSLEKKEGTSFAGQNTEGKNTQIIINLTHEPKSFIIEKGEDESLFGRQLTDSYGQPIRRQNLLDELRDELVGPPAPPTEPPNYDDSYPLGSSDSFLVSRHLSPPPRNQGFEAERFSSTASTASNSRFVGAQENSLRGTSDFANSRRNAGNNNDDSFNSYSAPETSSTIRGPPAPPERASIVSPTPPSRNNFKSYSALPSRMTSPSVSTASSSTMTRDRLNSYSTSENTPPRTGSSVVNPPAQSFREEGPMELYSVPDRNNFASFSQQRQTPDSPRPLSSFQRDNANFYTSPDRMPDPEPSFVRPPSRNRGNTQRNPTTSELISPPSPPDINNMMSYLPPESKPPTSSFVSPPAPPQSFVRPPPRNRGNAQRNPTTSELISPPSPPAINNMMSYLPPESKPPTSSFVSPPAPPQPPPTTYSVAERTPSPSNFISPPSPPREHINSYSAPERQPVTSSFVSPPSPPQPPPYRNNQMSYSVPNRASSPTTGSFVSPPSLSFQQNNIQSYSAPQRNSFTSSFNTFPKANNNVGNSFTNSKITRTVSSFNSAPTFSTQNSFNTLNSVSSSPGISVNSIPSSSSFGSPSTRTVITSPLTSSFTTFPSQNTFSSSISSIQNPSTITRTIQPISTTFSSPLSPSSSVVTFSRRIIPQGQSTSFLPLPQPPPISSPPVQTFISSRPANPPAPPPVIVAPPAPPPREVLTTTTLSPTITSPSSSYTAPSNYKSSENNQPSSPTVVLLQFDPSLLLNLNRSSESNDDSRPQQYKPLQSDNNREQDEVFRNPQNNVEYHVHVNSIQQLAEIRDLFGNSNREFVSSDERNEERPSSSPSNSPEESYGPPQRDAPTYNPPAQMDFQPPPPPTYEPPRPRDPPTYKPPSPRDPPTYKPPSPRDPPSPPTYNPPQQRPVMQSYGPPPTRDAKRSFKPRNRQTRQRVSSPLFNFFKRKTANRPRQGARNIKQVNIAKNPSLQIQKSPARDENKLQEILKFKCVFLCHLGQVEYQQEK